MNTHPPHLMEVSSMPPKTSWEEPILFHPLETPEISAHYLPGIFGEFAAAVAEATETPEALSIFTILGVLSTVCAQRSVVSPKAGWQEPVNIYTLIALPPANHKSWVLRRCIAPLVDFEKIRRKELDGEIKHQRSERKTQEKIIDALRNKAAKASDMALQRQLLEDIAYKESTLTEPAQFPVLFTNDATPESLTTLMHQQGGRLAIFSDEGGMLETLAGLYTAGVANVDILLKGIDGGELRVERKDRHLVLNPYLTIVFAVQPAILQNMVKKRAYANNGSLDRFLYVLPKSKLGYRSHQTQAIPTTMEEIYHAKILALLHYFSLLEQAAGLQVLTLNSEAYALWRDFQAEIEIELRPEGKFAACLGWGGKLCGFALRIAGLLHTAEYEFKTTVIAIHSMQNALCICRALIDHALAAFDLMGADAHTDDAKTLFQWIKAKKALFFTQSDMLLAMRNRKITAERLGKALCILQEHRLISAPIKNPTRKPTTLHYVNPKLFE